MQKPLHVERDTENCAAAFNVEARSPNMTSDSQASS
ncbi:MAG: hypothetical protein ACI9EH_000598, partial [Planktomarina sp.]